VLHSISQFDSIIDLLFFKSSFCECPEKLDILNYSFKICAQNPVDILEQYQVKILQSACYFAKETLVDPE